MQVLKPVFSENFFSGFQGYIILQSSFSRDQKVDQTSMVEAIAMQQDHRY